MRIRAVKLDVDWAITGPGVVAVAEAVDSVSGVEAATITITEIDLETVGTDIVVEGDDINLGELTAAIEKAGAVVHSVDQLSLGDRVVAYEGRAR